ncbi:hypothetical protein Acr_24g0006660 [Actinidia rufa]|uniref:Uncharacterized protein n=1 Tax=Actinidia rufa TaxID=165716 RepID=A0A7J0GUL0_9ERIC|nr:hypothetical protein Acr_24g0006660 [Actinidia rufa]
MQKMKKEMNLMRRGKEEWEEEDEEDEKEKDEEEEKSEEKGREKDKEGEQEKEEVEKQEKEGVDREEDEIDKEDSSETESNHSPIKLQTTESKYMLRQRAMTKFTNIVETTLELTPSPSSSQPSTPIHVSSPQAPLPRTSPPSSSPH